MKLTLLPLVALLLFNCCSCFYTMEIGPSTDVAKNVEPLAPNSQDKTHFTDLYDDAIFLIFDEFDLTSLLRMSQTSKQVSSLVTEYITRHFSLKYVCLTEAITGIPTSDSIFMNDKVDIRHFDIALSILKQFGSIIKRLVIFTHNFTPKQLELIVKYLNKYCADTLISLEFFGTQSMDSQLTKFSALENLLFTTDFKHFLNGKLNETFPNLKRLRIHGDVTVDLLDCVLPHLEHVDVELPFEESPLLPLTNATERFLRLNPQIKSIGLVGFPLSFLNTVNEVLPHLEHLLVREIISSDDQLGQNIRFENVKTFNFTAKSCDDSIINQFEFPKLDECQVVYSTNLYWSVFFANHKNLTKLHIRIEKNFFNPHLSELNFQQLVQLENLTEFSLIALEDIIQKEKIFEFLENHEKLTKCQFAMKPYGDDYEKSIRETLESNWIIDNFESITNILDLRLDENFKGFLLRRKRY